jgi:hypothetical protein
VIGGGGAASGYAPMGLPGRELIVVYYVASLTMVSGRVPVTLPSVCNTLYKTLLPN